MADSINLFIERITTAFVTHFAFRDRELFIKNFNPLLVFIILSILLIVIVWMREFLKKVSNEDDRLVIISDIVNKVTSLLMLYISYVYAFVTDNLISENIDDMNIVLIFSETLKPLFLLLIIFTCLGILTYYLKNVPKEKNKNF